MSEKELLRTRFAALRAAQGADFAAADAEIARKLLSLDAWKHARTVFVYVGVRAEIPTRGILRAAFESAKRVAVPKCARGGHMDAREIASLDELLPAPFGLLEPGANAPIVPPGLIDLAIVPCLAADRRGHRLGYGAGYYDRYLQSLRCPTACLCRAHALVDALPAEPHDVPASIVVTEREILHIR